MGAGPRFSRRARSTRRCRRIASACARTPCTGIRQHLGRRPRRAGGQRQSAGTAQWAGLRSRRLGDVLSPAGPDGVLRSAVDAACVEVLRGRGTGRARWRSVQVGHKGSNSSPGPQAGAMRSSAQQGAPPAHESRRHPADRHATCGASDRTPIAPIAMSATTGPAHGHDRRRSRRCHTGSPSACRGGPPDDERAVEHCVPSLRSREGADASRKPRPPRVPLLAAPRSAVPRAPREVREPSVWTAGRTPR